MNTRAQWNRAFATAITGITDKLEAAKYPVDLNSEITQLQMLQQIAVEAIDALSEIQAQAAKVKKTSDHYQSLIVELRMPK